MQKLYAEESKPGRLGNCRDGMARSIEDTKPDDREQNNAVSTYYASISTDDMLHPALNRYLRDTVNG